MENETAIRNSYRKHIRRKRAVLACTCVLVAALSVASLMVGSARLGAGQVLAALVGQADEYTRTVVWTLRMPRVLTAIIGGVALALAGCTYQGVLRNPLASASTLGISQGAAFGASVAIICLAGVGTGAAGAAGAADATGVAAGAASAAAFEGISAGNPFLTALCAFAGASLSTLAILALSRLRAITPETVVLAGVALSALFTGATALIQYFAEDSQVAAVVFWTFGDLGRTSYREIAIMAAVAAVSAAFFFANRWNYNAMETGDASAHGLGLNVQRTRLAGMAVATAAASTVIAFCGTINFIGLVAPHIMRRFLGSDYRYLLPASAVCGAGILLAGDLIARCAIAGLVLPISAITSFIGAPLFLYLLFKGAKR